MTVVMASGLGSEAGAGRVTSGAQRRAWRRAWTRGAKVPREPHAVPSTTRARRRRSAHIRRPEPAACTASAELARGLRQLVELRLRQLAFAAEGDADDRADGA